MGKFAYVCALTIVTSACGGGECEPGTTRVGDTCYPYDPFDHTPPTVAVDPPVRTRHVGTVRLTASEPAVIYYTTDGNVPTTMSASGDTQVVIPDQPDNAIVRYFAVDRAGNQSPVEAAAWQVDTTGPGAPSMAVAVSGTTRTVTWVPPVNPHLTTIVVARVDGMPGASPEPGQAFKVGDTISPGVTVVAVSTATTGMQTFSESMPTPPGLVRYLAWAEDDIGNYGAAGGAFAVVPMPDQTATVHVVASTGAVTVTTPAPNITIAGTATLVGSTLSVDLELTNATTRALFAPKVLLTNTLSGVTFSGNGTFNSLPYVAYGAAIGAASKAKRTWTFTGASSTTTLDLSLDVLNGPVLVGPHSRRSNAGDMVDPDTGASVGNLQTGISGPSGTIGMKPGGVTPEGRVILGSRTSGSLSMWDLESGTLVMSSDLLPQKATVAAVALDAGGASGYALAAYGHSYTVRQGTIKTYLVRFDVGSLTETGRIDLGTSRNRGMEISPDGRTLAIASGDPDAGTILVDLGTFTLTRHVGVGFVSRWATFSSDSKTVIVVGTSEVHSFSVADGTQSGAVPMPAGTGGKVFRGDIAGDGRLWIGRTNDVLAIDLATGSGTSYPNQGAILTVFDGKAYVGREGSTSFERLDNTGTSEITLSFGDTVYGHSILRSPF
jgi:hypothetical protein